MRLSDIKGEEAIEVVAELIEPITSIGMNKVVKKADRSNRIEYIKTLLIECKSEVYQMLAILDRTPIEEYDVSLLDITGKLMELFSDPVIQELFGLQSQTEETSSGSAMENTEVEKN